MARPAFALALALLLTSALARPQFRALIPNGDAAARPGSGITCAQLGHVNCVSGAKRNKFGLDFQSAGLKWTKALCNKDSDRDGLTNGEELGDPCCVWRPGRKPARSNFLSHPGESRQDGARNAPPCGVKAPTNQGR